MNGVLEVRVVDRHDLVFGDFRQLLAVKVHAVGLVRVRQAHDLRLDAIRFAELFQIALKSRPNVNQTRVVPILNRAEKTVFRE